MSVVCEIADYDMVVILTDCIATWLQGDVLIPQWNIYFQSKLLAVTTTITLSHKTHNILDILEVCG